MLDHGAIILPQDAALATMDFIPRVSGLLFIPLSQLPPRQTTREKSPKFVQFLGSNGHTINHRLEEGLTKVSGFCNRNQDVNDEDKVSDGPPTNHTVGKGLSLAHVICQMLIGFTLFPNVKNLRLELLPPPKEVP